MPIKVIYENDALDEIEPSVLDKLIASNKIKKLFRSDGWATVGTDPIRGMERSYEGPERRKNPLSISPRLSYHLSMSEDAVDGPYFDVVKSVVDTMREPFLVLDADLMVISANKSFYKVFKVTPAETVGGFIFYLRNRQWDIAGLRKLLDDTLIRNTGVADYEVEHTFPDIGHKIMRLNARRIYQEEIKKEMIFLSVEDITERRRLEQEVLKLQKLESVGVLAGGIAHDFNNLLTGILGNISLARIVPQDKIYERLVWAEKAAVKAKDLTRQLLTFSKGGAPVRKTIFPQIVIRDSVALSSSGGKAICEVSIPDDLWPIDADEGQISQAINNLIINAEHAMPEGGKIIVDCKNIEITECAHLPLKGGKYINIIVKDEGIGIPEENLGKIFEPFFTTKEKGTGLGLATTCTIIKNHEGHIAVESTAKSGTVFNIYLPASGSQATPRKPWEVQVKSDKGKILIMDDEEVVRQVSGEMLKYIGYEVESAKDGPGAIELHSKALKSGRPFDLVIMDLTIPGGMGGKETIRKILEIDPDVRAIVSSGYTKDPVMSNFRDFGFVGKIEKPFKIGELSVQIRKVINGQFELF